MKNESDKLRFYTRNEAKPSHHRGSRFITGTISQQDLSEMFQNCPSKELELGEKEMGLFDHIMELRSFFILYLTVSSV